MRVSKPKPSACARRCLSAVSHDLKTPLASILGNISSVREYAHLYDDATRDEMLASAQTEAERLSRFVSNLLHMTRIDAGAVRPTFDMVDFSDVVGSGDQERRPAARPPLGARRPRRRAADDASRLRVDRPRAGQSAGQRGEVRAWRIADPDRRAAKSTGACARGRGRRSGIRPEDLPTCLRPLLPCRR